MQYVYDKFTWIPLLGGENGSIQLWCASVCVKSVVHSERLYCVCVENIAQTKHAWCSGCELVQAVYCPVVSSGVSGIESVDFCAC
jgi:hypothetical protein